MNTPQQTHSHPLRLMYITNDPVVARIADGNRVDRIWIDLEFLGKHLRQENINSVKSNHTISDISVIKAVLESSQLVVRINPLYEGSEREIREAILRGADLIMLPMYRTMEEAKRFVDMVGGRAKTVLLLETIAAEQCVSETLAAAGADEIHIGLNDLHLEYRLDFMFQLLSNGTVDRIVGRIKPFGVPYGFGGVGRIGSGTLPAESILAEHYRLGSSMVILSRSFYKPDRKLDPDEAQAAFSAGVRSIREYESRLRCAPPEFFEKNRNETAQTVKKVLREIRYNKKDTDATTDLRYTETAD